MNRFPTRAVDFLLVGGGLSSATAAETLRLEGAEGSVVIVSAEHRLPYHRPPLSGRLKLEEPREPPLVLGEEDYRARGIELLRGHRRQLHRHGSVLGAAAAGAGCASRSRRNRHLRAAPRS